MHLHRGLPFVAALAALVPAVVGCRGSRPASDRALAPASPSALATPVASGGMSLREALSRRRSSRAFGPREPSLEQLGALAWAAQGVTDPASGHRTAPSAGGLYPLDTYVLARAVDGLPAGLYHYNIATVALERMPARPVDEVVRDGFFWQDWVCNAAAIVLLVAAFDRTLAKYGDRGYRLVLLDAGHAAQNLLLVAEQERLGACAVAGFCDDALAADLGIDGVDEAVVHSVVLGARSV